MKSKKIKIRNLTQGEMNKVNVEIVEDVTNIRLKCKQCGQIWSPNIQPGGKMPQRYWNCPNGCNT